MSPPSSVAAAEAASEAAPSCTDHGTFSAEHPTPNCGEVDCSWRPPPCHADQPDQPDALGAGKSKLAMHDAGILVPETSVSPSADTFLTEHVKQNRPLILRKVVHCPARDWGVEHLMQYEDKPVSVAPLQARMDPKKDRMKKLLSERYLQMYHAPATIISVSSSD
eukprot:6176040-Pleurochrysis_carterae.AAC.6